MLELSHTLILPHFQGSIRLRVSHFCCQVGLILTLADAGGEAKWWSRKHTHRPHVGAVAKPIDSSLERVRHSLNKGRGQDALLVRMIGVDFGNDETGKLGT
jgi:hypothetical protein